MDCTPGRLSTVGTVMEIDVNIRIRQVWGFEEVKGKRLFVRRVVVKKDDQIEKVKLVYDFESD